MRQSSEERLAYIIGILFSGVVHLLCAAGAVMLFEHRVKGLDDVAGPQHLQIGSDVRPPGRGHHIVAKIAKNSHGYAADTSGCPRDHDLPLIFGL